MHTLFSLTASSGSKVRINCLYTRRWENIHVVNAYTQKNPLINTMSKRYVSLPCHFPFISIFPHLLTCKMKGGGGNGAHPVWSRKKKNSASQVEFFMVSLAPENKFFCILLFPHPLPYVHTYIHTNRAPCIFNGGSYVRKCRKKKIHKNHIHVGIQTSVYFIPRSRMIIQQKNIYYAFRQV